jgi:hypothetical protein
MVVGEEGVMAKISLLSLPPIATPKPKLTAINQSTSDASPLRAITPVAQPSKFFAMPPERMPVKKTTLTQWTSLLSTLETS